MTVSKEKKPIKPATQKKRILFIPRIVSKSNLLPEELDKANYGDTFKDRSVK